ncbi:MAG: hypothetical protein F4Y80_17550 [Caldilineaceae bacterium SB0665_bin_21]|nr:hypothetical protein [Caldilineaceae bacterium SB0665_bin_21]
MLVLKHNPRHRFTAALAATEEFHIRSAVGTADHRQEGRGQDVVPRRQPGPFHSGIFDLVEEVHRGTAAQEEVVMKGHFGVGADNSNIPHPQLPIS